VGRTLRGETLPAKTASAGALSDTLKKKNTAPQLSLAYSFFFPSTHSPGTQTTMASTIGLVGLAVMGQNLALNVAEKGFPISVYNRSSDKTDAAVARAQKEGE
jgi:hypothetical protein